MNSIYELRKDPLLDRWVIVAKNPIASLSDYISNGEKSDDIETCLFCHGKESNTPPEITAIRKPDSEPNREGWFIRVIPNLKQVLEQKGELNSQGVGMYDKMEGIGTNEIIIESPEHYNSFADMDVEQVRKVLLTYKERNLTFENDPRLKYILISKSYGKAAGALYNHPHSHLIATPIIPKRIKDELEGAKFYYNLKERCIFCDIIREELSMVERVIYKNKNFLVFCPFAPTFPFEIWIIPLRHCYVFQGAEMEELEDLGITITTVLKKLRRLLNDPPYNLILHNGPKRVSMRNHGEMLSEYFHWHIEIIPCLTGSDGFEWNTGLYILNISPEEGAKYLKEA